MVDYDKRLSEVSVILNHMSKDNYNKIPKDVIEGIEKNKDKNYVWIYDEKKELKDQNINRDTIAILTYLNMQYILNEKQKEYVKKILIDNQNKVEEEKNKKYNASTLFEKQESEKIDINKDKENNENKNISVVKKEKNSFIKRLLDKIKKFFNRNNSKV